MKALILAAAALVAVIGSARAESGIASHYSTRELGTRTASGRPLHDGALTASHDKAAGDVIARGSPLPFLLPN
jgi:rare lipoprotein A (peptidoglycan hydrolase)